MNKIIKLNESVYHIHESNNVYSTLVIGSQRALLIDTGYGCSGLLQTISSLTDKPLVVVNTHGHLDHIQMNNRFSSVYIHHDDIWLLRLNSNILFKCLFYLLFISKLTKPEKQHFLSNITLKSPKIKTIKEGDVIDLGETSIRVIETPGHTKGSVCLLDEKNHFLYCGDSVSNHVWICLKESLTIPVYIESLERLGNQTNDSYKIVASHSDEPLNYIVLEKLIHCAKNIDIKMTTEYNNPFCKKSLLYCEGIDYLKEQYNISSFEEAIEKIDIIDKDVFRNGKFVSIVFRLDKL